MFSNKLNNIECETNLNQNLNQNIDSEFIAYYNGWSMDFTMRVQLEYERFLSLRFTNNNLSPSKYIDIFWHTHILNTRDYITYCVNKYGEIIHHNPKDSMDQIARNKRLLNTLKEYKKKYGEFEYKNIWMIDEEFLNDDESNMDLKKKSFVNNVEINNSKFTLDAPCSSNLSSNLPLKSSKSSSKSSLVFPSNSNSSNLMSDDNFFRALRKNSNDMRNETWKNIKYNFDVNNIVNGANGPNGIGQPYC